MKIFRANENAEIPSYATKGSAAFDLKACFDETTKIRAFNPHNREMNLPVKRWSNGVLYVQALPQFRTLIPTGLIFDIPEKYVLKFYIRSSMALKHGISLANDVAIIDSDYVDPAYIMVYNMCDTPINIYHGDRIAQAILEKNVQVDLEEAKEIPARKTDRAGGLGSTGTN
jgi:dUTP pyrophosphatase